MKFNLEQLQKVVSDIYAEGYKQFSIQTATQNTSTKLPDLYIIAGDELNGTTYKLWRVASGDENCGPHDGKVSITRSAEL